MATKAKWYYARMASLQRSPLNRATLIRLDQFKLEDDQSVDLCLIEHTSVVNQRVEDIKWRRSIFDHVDFSGSVLKRLSFIDCRLEYCQCANADWSEALIDRSVFDSSKLTGIKLNEAALQDIEFKNCKLDFAQFQGIKSKQIVFDHCEIQHAYFNNADLKGVRFDHCDLSQADFSQAKLLGADFRGSVIEGIRLDPTKLPKVKVDLAQAIYLVRLLGLEIE